MACDSFIHICDSVWVSLHTIDTANDYYELCARLGVIPDPATFRPLLKKVCNNPSWHKAIFFVASHLHPPYTRKWHAPALQRIKGHIIGARRTTGKKLNPRSFTGVSIITILQIRMWVVIYLLFHLQLREKRINRITIISFKFWKVSSRKLHFRRMKVSHL